MIRGACIKITGKLLFWAISLFSKAAGEEIHGISCHQFKCTCKKNAKGKKRRDKLALFLQRDHLIVRVGLDHYRLDADKLRKFVKRHGRCYSTWRNGPNVAYLAHEMEDTRWTCNEAWGAKEWPRVR